MSDDGGWFLYTAEGQSGPYDAGQIRDWLAAGSITGEWSAWREGRAEWRPISEIAELTTARPIPRPAAYAPPEMTDEATPLEEMVAPRRSPESASLPQPAARPRREEPTKEKSKRGGPSLAFIVIVVLLLSGGGYLMWLKSTNLPAFVAFMNSCGVTDDRLRSWGMVVDRKVAPK